MQKLISLEGRHTGSPGAVLCGGPGMAAKIPAVVGIGAVLIGVNEHALKIIRPDYIVVNDAYNTRTNKCWPEVFEEINENVPPIVSKIGPLADFDPTGAPIWEAGFSGGTAAWLALYMGCDPVILCGADCYTGDRDYAWNAPGERPRGDWLGGDAEGATLDEQLDAWREAFDHCPRPERIRAAEWPLTEIFPVWPERINGQRAILSEGKPVDERRKNSLDLAGI